MKPTAKVFSMFLAVMLQASMIFGIISCSVNDNNGGHEPVAADTIVYRFASQEEGRRLKLANTSYFNSLSQNDLDWKTLTIGQTLAGYKAIAAEQIMDFTDEEKQAMTWIMHDIEARCAELGIKLPCKDDQKRRCTLIATYPSSYADAVAVNPDADFFYDAQMVLVPLDEPDTMIPIEEATDFYDIMGRNLDYNYVDAAEENLATNFSYLISYGFDGHYEYSEEDDEVILVPYETPQLIRNIYDLLRKFWP